MNGSDQQNGQTECTSFWPSPMPLPFTIHLIVLISIASVMTLVCNLTLIYSLKKTKQLDLIINKFVLAMSISDILHGVLVMPVFAITLALRAKRRLCLLEKGTHFGFYFLGYFSYMMLMCVAFDRYFQMRRLRNNGSVFTSTHFKVILPFSILFSVFFGYAGITFMSFPFQVTNCVVNIFLISTVLVMYSRLLSKIRIHNNNFTKMMKNANFAGQRPNRVDMTASKTISMLLGTLFFIYAPFNITTPMLSYWLYEKKSQTGLSLGIATFWAYFLIMCYCFINALIFSYGNGKIRRFVMRLMQGIGSAEQSSSSTMMQNFHHQQRCANKSIDSSIVQDMRCMQLAKEGQTPVSPKSPLRRVDASCDPNIISLWARSRNDGTNNGEA